MRLEDITPSARVRGIPPDASITVVNVQWHGSDALSLVNRGPDGRVADETLYRHDEARLDVVEQARHGASTATATHSASSPELSASASLATRPASWPCATASSPARASPTKDLYEWVNVVSHDPECIGRVFRQIRDSMRTSRIRCRGGRRGWRMGRR